MLINADGVKIRKEGEVNVIHMKCSLPDAGQLHKMLKHRSSQSRRKCNTAIRKATPRKLYECWWVKTNVGLAPHNTRSGTTYMIAPNTQLLAVQRNGWVALYITHGLEFDSVHDVMEKCKYVRGNNSHEFKEYRDIPREVVFRAPAKVAVKQLVSNTKVLTGAALEALQAVYCK